MKLEELSAESSFRRNDPTKTEMHDEFEQSN